MLSIGNKTFMNLQEAVGWLLENNALPFQSTANYAGGVEIAMSTLINPSPAKVRVGSMIFFADSKVSTVVGVTSNSFIVSDQYNDLVDDIVYVSNVAINASGHLIVTLSNGDTIDAGLIKQVSSFSIDASQHLIVSYNDGSTTDLGAIFSGNINISGTLNATAITGNSIIETMVGSYSFVAGLQAQMVYDLQYAGACKNGNKITFVIAGKIKRIATAYTVSLGSFIIPAELGQKLYPTDGQILEYKNVYCAKDQSTGVTLPLNVYKNSDTSLIFRLDNAINLTQDQDYFVRAEVTFLLSPNMLS